MRFDIRRLRSHWMVIKREGPGGRSAISSTHPTLRHAMVSIQRDVEAHEAERPAINTHRPMIYEVGLRHGRAGKPSLYHRNGRVYDSKNKQDSYARGYSRGSNERREELLRMGDTKYR